MNIWSYKTWLRAVNAKSTDWESVFAIGDGRPRPVAPLLDGRTEKSHTGRCAARLMAFRLAAQFLGADGSGRQRATGGSSASLICSEPYRKSPTKNNISKLESSVFLDTDWSGCHKNPCCSVLSKKGCAFTPRAVLPERILKRRLQV